MGAHRTWVRVRAAGVLAAALPLLATASACGDSAQRATEVDVVAHRGASGQAPENTAAAFKLAVDQHADLIETDVQETKDGALVLIHDSTLSRTTNVENRYPNRPPWNVGDFTLAEIKTLDAGSWYAPRFAGQRVPTLGETLDLLGGDVGLELELKEPDLYPGIVAKVADALRAHPAWLKRARHDRLMVSSFDWGALRSFHEKLPDIPVAAIGSTVPSGGKLTRMARWVDAFSPDFRHVDADDAARIRDADLGLLPWTLNRPEHMRRAIDRGATGVVTNNPSAAVRLLDERSGTPGATGAVTNTADPPAYAMST